jgi:hypothetical protein
MPAQDLVAQPREPSLGMALESALWPRSRPQSALLLVIRNHRPLPLMTLELQRLREVAHRVKAS